MGYDYRITRKVEFSETDMAGIVHFSNFFRYMEMAEHAFFRSLGFSVVMDDRDPPLGWPRVHAECDYRHPLRFEDDLEVRLLVVAKHTRSITYAFRFTKLNSQPPAEVARGRLIVVCVRRSPDGRLTAAHLPPDVAGKVEAAPPELLKEWAETDIRIKPKSPSASHAPTP